jgi:hypothetical protein
MALPFVSSSALRSIRLDPRIQTKNLVYGTLAMSTPPEITYQHGAALVD